MYLDLRVVVCSGVLLIDRSHLRREEARRQPFPSIEKFYLRTLQVEVSVGLIERDNDRFGRVSELKHTR